MSAIAVCAPPVVDTNSPSATSACRDTVRKLVASLTPPRSAVERRGDRRFPFPYPVRVAAIGSEHMDSKFTVIGKHLSESGFGFYHQEPLPYRRVHVWLGSPIGLEVQMVMDLSWCRFVGQGWYVSGGRFVETIKG
ncbi:MAG: hypothetical protein MI757_13735 [Pirellulales bacterium]|nr:hypothetical protein [Pirellulales bacterium]